MAADILWSDLVGTATTADGGHIGDLLQLARAHVDEAVRSNELTHEQAGAIYTSMIPAAFQHGIQFGLQEQLTEAQIDKAVADARIATEQVNIAKSNVALEKAKAIASIDKEYGYAYTLDADDNIIIGVDTGDGKLDAEVADITFRRKVDVLNSQIGAWTSIYNGGKADNLPDIVSDTSIETLYNEVK